MISEEKYGSICCEVTARRLARNIAMYTTTYAISCPTTVILTCFSLMELAYIRLG